MINQMCNNAYAMFLDWFAYALPLAFRLLVAKISGETSVWYATQLIYNEFNAFIIFFIFR